MKFQCLSFLFSATVFFASAQSNPELPSFSIGAQATRSLSTSQTGISGNISALWHTPGKSPDRWLASVKISHVAKPNEKFLSVFDNGATNNLTTLSLLGGYRIGIKINEDVNKPYDPYFSKMYVEGQAGVAFVGSQKVSPTFITGIGYNLIGNLEINTFGQWMKNYKKSLWLIGLGAAYTF